jgi:AcrR family transcriptional regulator
MARSPRARKLILDAAERLVRDQGAAALTYEHVVAESGITRGGITYHFPTKDSLLRALVERDQERWEQLIIAHQVRAADAAGARCVGYIRAATDHDEDHRRFVSGMLSAVAHDASLLDGCRALYRKQIARPRWTDADIEQLVPMLAADGLFWMEQFGFLSLPPATRRRLVERIEALARASATPVEASPSPSKTKIRSRAKS